MYTRFRKYVKTRRTNDINFANVLQNDVVNLTLLLPMSQNTSYKCHFCRTYVKTCRKNDLNFANMSKHVVKMTLVLHMCKNTS